MTVVDETHILYLNTAFRDFDETFYPIFLEESIIHRGADQKLAVPRFFKGADSEQEDSK